MHMNVWTTRIHSRSKRTELYHVLTALSASVKSCALAPLAHVPSLDLEYVLPRTRMRLWRGGGCSYPLLWGEDRRLKGPQTLASLERLRVKLRLWKDGVQGHFSFSPEDLKLGFTPMVTLPDQRPPPPQVLVSTHQRLLSMACSKQEMPRDYAPNTAVQKRSFQST